jgi:hypothetical protein
MKSQFLIFQTFYIGKDMCGSSVTLFSTFWAANGGLQSTSNFLVKMQKALPLDALIEKKVTCTSSRVDQHHVIQLYLKTSLGEKLAKSSESRFCARGKLSSESHTDRITSDHQSTSNFTSDLWINKWITVRETVFWITCCNIWFWYFTAIGTFTIQE